MARGRIGPGLNLADVLEKDWDAQLFGSKDGLATTLGWNLVYHTLRSKGSRSGFPDRVIVRDRCIFAELKREKTGPTDEQIRWLDGLVAAGMEVYLWRPSDLEEIGLILGKRWTFAPALISGFVGLSPPLLTARDETLIAPRSAWVAGGRADALFPVKEAKA